jgi:hypothetical protein
MAKKPGQFVKDDPRINREGRPEGTKNYETLRKEAIIQLAKANKVTPQQIEIMLHTKGIGEALKGNFQFYKDDMDRTYGQAKNNLDLTSGGLPIPIIPLNNVIPTNNSDKQDTDTPKEIENNTGGDIGKQDNLNTPILDSNGSVRQATDTNEHSVGELSTLKEGSGEGLSEHNEGTPVL